MHVREIVSMLLVVALSMIVGLPGRHDHCICNYRRGQGGSLTIPARKGSDQPPRLAASREEVGSASSHLISPEGPEVAWTGSGPATRPATRTTGPRGARWRTPTRRN